MIWLASGLWNEVCTIIWLWETGCAYDECGGLSCRGDLLDQLVQWMDGTSFHLQCCLSMMTTYWSQVHLSMLVSISINDHTLGEEFIYGHILEQHNKISQPRTSGLKFCQNNWFIFWQRQSTINHRRFVHQMSIVLLYIFCETHCNIFTVVVSTDINYFASTMIVILLCAHLHMGLLSTLASN